MSATELPAVAAPAPGRARQFWRSFSENRGAVVGLGLMIVLIIVASLADLVAPHSPIEQFREHFLAPPIWQEGGVAEFPLGTDDVGRDMLSRLIYGARLSLMIGFSVASLALITGTTLGLIAAFAGGITDILIMRLMDILLVFPSLLLAIVIVAILGPGLFNAMLAVVIVTLPGYTRLARASALAELARDYVTATRSAGAGPLRLMFDTVLPNCLAPLIVQVSLGFASAILDAAALGFLGLGAQPPTPEWGTMLAGALQYYQRAWWVLTFPGLAILFTVYLGFNLFGDGLRDALDPKLKTLMSLLEIRNLAVEFATARGRFRAVDGVDVSIDTGEILCIVGESGSGKSVSMLAVMGLIAWPGRVSADVLRFDGIDLLNLAPRQRRRLIGKDIAMVFQEPMSSLNPCYPVGWQIAELLRVHHEVPRRQVRDRVVELLDQVGIPAPATRLGAFPHQLSGGMNQRVMIAMAISCNPRLLIADEPTTALDVTIQKQILDLLISLQRQRGMALALITHDMGVVAETAQRVQVMYAGQMVEEQPTDSLFAAPRHPYTAALLDALPERALGKARLPTIPGMVPGIDDRPVGCLFNPRCRFVFERCLTTPPSLAGGPGARARCHTPLDAAGHPAPV